MAIRLLKHKEINKTLYDYCIENSPQGTIYAMSWYLDVVAPGWELLLTDDYQYVMPIPVKKKMGFRYALQPLFCQQLGVFSQHVITVNLLEEFIKKIPCSYYNLQFNAGNFFDPSGVLIRSNYTLDLNQPYDVLKKQYKANCIRNIKKATHEDLIVHGNMSENQYLRMIQDHSGNRPIKHLLPLYSRLLSGIKQYAHDEIWHVTDQNNTVLSCACFFFWKNRIYYMVPVSTTIGKEKNSMSLLLDRLIATYADRPLILDFEGSSIPGIARYYESFGATNDPYPVLLKKNMLFKIRNLITFK